MLPTQFVLIRHHGTQNPRKQHALQVMEVKAHAARMSHIKRRKKQQQAGYQYCSNCHRPLQAQISSQLASTHVLLYANSFLEDAYDITDFCLCPQTLLGQGRLDPFDSGQSDELPEMMRRGLDYVYEVLWPMNSPALQGALLRNTIVAWRAASVQSALEYHAQISNAASLCLASSADPAMHRTLTLVRLIHQNKAIQLIQRAINALTQPASVALIACIMNVSTSGLQDLIPPREQPIPESPVSKGFNFALYARFKPTEEHFQASAALVKQRGGLETLPPGLAHPLQLEDVHRANRRIGEPKFSLIAFLAERAATPAYEFDAHANKLYANLGSGFRLSPDQPYDIRLRQVILQACKFTAAIDQYQRNSPLRCRMSELATQSIIILHQLLTPPTLENGTSSEGLYRYDIVRLSTLIYANLVIFPSGSRAQPRHGLAQLLYARLSSYYQCYSSRDSESSTWDNELLWSVVLGGIASTGIDIRPWFVAQVSNRIADDGLTWDKLHGIASSFLYWGYVMAGPMRNLWDDATEMHLQTNQY